MSRRTIALALAGLSFAAGGRAYTEGEQDVSHPLQTVLLDRQAKAHRIPDLSAKGPRAKREILLPDRGNIAIVDDGDGVGLPAFPFDLEGKTVEIIPAADLAAAYTYRTRDGGYDATAAATGDFLTLSDDAYVRLPLGFPFPYFGKAWDEAFLHSDGHITFGEPDVAQTARDAPRAVSGPPRIAAFFWDLDPSQSGAAVRYVRTADRLTVSWINVPEWAPEGAAGLRQNFQATLFADGRIELAYQSITLDLGTIGVASGENIFDSLAVDFTEPAPAEPFTAAFVELFFPADLNLATLGRKFYLSHEDAYDFLVIFHDYEIPLETNAFAFYRQVRNFTQGVGPWPAGFEANNVVDFGVSLGSPFRLQGLMYMGELDKYPDDPAQLIARDEGVHGNTALSVLAHEAGHIFLATPLIIDRLSNVFSFDLLGRQFAHWSYFFNSDASFLEGNRIVDHGRGPYRFETTETTKGFSRLDRYLLGLEPPETVQPSFYVRNPSIDSANFSAAHFPLGGVFFDGERVNVSIEQIREAMGRRVPDHTVSQKSYRYAFVLLTQEGGEPSDASIAKLERFRTQFEQTMREASGGGWQGETELVQQLTFVTWPASGVLQGETIDGGVLLGNVLDHDLTVQLRGGDGVRIPEEVTVPAGNLFEPFTIEGVTGGVYPIQGDAGDEFEIANSLIQVQPGTSAIAADRLLPLEILFGDPSERLMTGEVGRPMPFPFLVQTTDLNALFYSNVPLRMTASGDGVVEPSETGTDEFGFGVFDWTLATTPGKNTLTIEVVGSDRPPLVLEATGVHTPIRQRNPRREIFR
jgi:hypothetical protein